VPGPTWPVLRPLELRAVEHLALDEVLLDAVAAGSRGPCLRFWSWAERCLVLGSHQSVANEVDASACAALGFSVVRRMSGGGTMVCEPGATLTYSLYLPDTFVRGLSFVESFAYLDAWVVDALRGLGVPAGYRPINDIISLPGGGKIAGAAQARRRGAVLHHTTAAYSTDPAVVPRLIRIGRPGVVARGLRSAEREVTPLARFLTLSLGAVVEELMRAAGGPASDVTEAELRAARGLAESKYATEAWINRLP
jgi:lipoate---protein ligase